MQKKIVILTAGFGNGHKTAAFGIKKQLEKSENIKNIEIIDIAEKYLAGKILKFIFENSSFWILEKIYTTTNKPKFSWLDKLCINICFYNLNIKLQKINKNNTLEIYITFPMLQILDICFTKNTKNIKTIIQCTDFYTPHLSWAWNSENISEIRVLDKHSTIYIANKLNLYNKNLEKKIKISEFPLTISNKSSKTSNNSKIVLCFFHNVLLGNEEEIIQKIHASEKYKNYKIIILAGKNSIKIKKFLYFQTDMHKNHYEILDWIKQSEINKYYDKAEIVAGKCGGAFIAEVIKLQKKIIITGVFSLQEDGNFQYMKEYHSDLIVDL